MWSFSIKFIRSLLSNAQMGFRKGGGCTDAIFALRELSKKDIEYNNDLNLEPEGTQNPPRHSL